LPFGCLDLCGTLGPADGRKDRSPPPGVQQVRQVRQASSEDHPSAALRGIDVPRSDCAFSGLGSAARSGRPPTINRWRPVGMTSLIAVLAGRAPDANLTHPLESIGE